MENFSQEPLGQKSPNFNRVETSGHGAKSSLLKS
jgi:hypothetical protein